MIKLTSVPDITDHYADWLSSFEWTHYATFTTGYEMTLNTARRLMEAYHSNVKKAGNTPFFWVAERFEVKDGFHTHALIKVPQAWHYSHLIQIWQKVTGGARENKWHRIDLQKYDAQLGARHYLSKYLTKGNSDFDFLI